MAPERIMQDNHLTTNREITPYSETLVSVTISPWQQWNFSDCQKSRKRCLLCAREHWTIEEKNIACHSVFVTPL